MCLTVYRRIILEDKMRAIATVCLSGDLRTKLEAIARAGFDGVEIFENDLLSFDGSPEEVSELCRRLKLKIVVFQPFRDFEAMPDPQRSRNLKRAERKFDLMEQLGTDFLLVCSNVSPQTIDDMDRAVADLRERCFPGQGRFPLKAFMSELAKTGYDGPLSLEIFSDAFRAVPTEVTALDGLRSLILLENLVEDGPWASHIPPAPGYNGIHFIEFTLDEESAAPLGEFIDALGFRHVGRHRSKNVELWKQGDIHLVLNFETDSFAHTFRLLHGTSVCAVGFRVDDVEKLLARAKAFKARTLRSQVGEGEMEIPALRGIEGSLVYLVDDEATADRQWRSDFELFDQESRNEAGLTRVDHLSYVLPATQLLSWQLFHRTVFGFDAEAEHETVDPRGMMTSQAVNSPDGSIRLPLTISQAQDTVSGRFLNEFRGGVQQIAFASQDIFATVDEVQARGLPLLRIPGNYFEILDRRGGYNQFGQANTGIRLAAQAAQR